MVQTSLNVFDLIVLVIIGTSGLLSFYRGFVREILSLGAWLGASLLTLYLFPKVGGALEPQLKNAAAASGIAATGVFLVSLVTFSIMSGFVIKFFKSGSEIGFLDNFAGLLFGVARGILFVAVGYFIFSLVTPEKNYPDWVKESASRPYVAKVARGLAKIAPNYLHELIEKKPEIKPEPLPSSTENPTSLPAANPATGAAPTTQDHIPSIEELQKQMREENEKNDVR